MSKIIFISNYKSGAGVTNTTINLANQFSKLGKNVLTIDLDSQGTLSEILVYENTNEKYLKDISDVGTLNYIFELYMLKMSKYTNMKLEFSRSMIRKTGSGYSYIPTSPFYRNVKGLDTLASEMKDNIEYLSILKRCIDTIRNEYDYILLDCPPTMNMITKSAFLMSDFYLIPTVLDMVSINGVVWYIKNLENVYKNYCIEGINSIFVKHYFKEKSKLIGVFYNKIGGNVDSKNTEESFIDALKNENLEVYIFPYDINNYEKLVDLQLKNDFEEFANLVIKRIEKM